MIPRTKASYRLADLLRAVRVRDRSERLRNALSGELVSLLGTPNILLSGSGRGALYIVLKCLPHRRVLVPAYTCKAVVEAAFLAGKEVVFGELEPDGFNMSIDAVKAMLNADTILLATHQFGIPCEIKAMVRYARQAGAFVLEDVAAALGTCVEGRLTGTFGDAAFFSFDSTKLVNVPLKGGALCVKDQVLYDRCVAFQKESTFEMPFERKIKYIFLGLALLALENPLLYRWFHNAKFRWRGRYTDDSVEFSPRLGPFYLDQLSEWQAAILLPQIRGLWQAVSTRQRIYSEYLRKLSKVSSFALPPPDNCHEWAPIRFPIRVVGNKLEFYQKAVRLGVDFAFSFTFIASPKEYVLSHDLAARILDLPFYERLTSSEIDKVVAVLCELDSRARELEG
jgi:dTDP-4-amino-4,6-dideoxygalactose transaminase